MLVQCSSSSIVAQIQQIEQIAAIFQAKSKDLSGASNFVCQIPNHMPDTIKKLVGLAIRVPKIVPIVT